MAGTQPLRDNNGFRGGGQRPSAGLPTLAPHIHALKGLCKGLVCYDDFLPVWTKRPPHSGHLIR
jgi:hypothetical protein